MKLTSFTILLVSLLFVPLLTSAQRTGSEAFTAPDTIYVSNQAKSYLLFDAPVSLADVGNPNLYQAQIEGSSVLVVATEDSVADTPFYAVVEGKPFTARLVFRKHPEAFYDFRERSNASTTTAKPTAEEQVLGRLKEMQSYHDLNYAAARDNGIRFRLVGLVHDLSTTYLKFKVENHTSLIYRTDFIGFERLKRYKKGFFAKDQQAHFPLDPVAEWQVNSVLPYSEGYLYYAIPLQSLERKEAIIATLRETGSTRSVSLNISSRLIRKANLY